MRGRESCGVRHVGDWFQSRRRPDRYIYRAPARGHECESNRDRNCSGHWTKLPLRADARLSPLRGKPNSQWSANRWEASPKVLLPNFHVCTSVACGIPLLESSLAIRPIFSQRHALLHLQTQTIQLLLCFVMAPCSNRFRWASSKRYVLRDSNPSQKTI